MYNSIQKMLSTIEARTKVDLSYILKGGSLMFLMQVMTATFAFATTLVLTTLLPREAFGQYRFVLSVLPLLAIFTLPGIDTAFTRIIARGQTPRLQTLVRTKMQFGVIGTLVALGIALYFGYKGNELLTVLFSITALSIPFFDTFLIYTAYYRGTKDFKSLATYETIARVIQSIVLIITALISKNIVVLIFAFLASVSITRLSFYRKLLTHYSPNKDVTVHTETTRYGKQLSAINALGVLSTNIDKILIWYFLGAPALAVYIVALILPRNVLAVLFSPLEIIAAPKLSVKLWNTLEKKIFMKKLFFLSFVVALPVFLYIILAKLIFLVAFSTYPDSIILSQIIAVVLIFTIPRGLVREVFVATKKNNLIVSSLFIHLLTTTLFIYIGIQMYGIFGAVLGYFGAELLTTIASYMFLWYGTSNTILHEYPTH